MSVDSNVGLQRALGFWALVAFGVGDILGAGIYALVGKIAGVAGYASWISFLIALGVAAITALSYAELGSQFPKSGGESLFCQHAFRPTWPARLMGWLVLCSGVVSMATVSRGMAGYVQRLAPQLPTLAIALLFLVALTGIVFWGMQVSSRVNMMCTMIEIIGLVIVIVVGIGFLRSTANAPVLSVPVPAPTRTQLLQGGALAFFAFIGFEDMVNVAEETHAPTDTMPRAILTALAIAGTIYMLIAVIAVQVLTPHELAASAAPLLDVVRRAAPAIPVGLFAVIAAFAIANTALLNCIMGSRLLYGMAIQGLVPAAFGRIHPQRRTPHIALLAVIAVAALLVCTGSLTWLAGTTSALLLVVFSAVNLALVVLKRRGTAANALRLPIWVPLLGVCASLGLLAFVPPRAVFTALGMMLLGGVIMGGQRVIHLGRA